eukprot:TRINITY_DN2023_c0_g1_i1.p1 TRINITY_DN2023_c0_g1~~TRINITY_DN2023_c0_g1_i1.p1  ORF type:complete len:390 (+),score=3.48 TRINITY_DN2023_c0_g1_i1:113-1282(+)
MARSACCYHLTLTQSHEIDAWSGLADTGRILKGKKLLFKEDHFCIPNKRQKTLFRPSIELHPITPDEFSNLPEELVSLILSFGSFTELANFGLVSKWCWKMFWRHVKIVSLKEKSELVISSILHNQPASLVQFQLDKCEITSFTFKFLGTCNLRNLSTMSLSHCSLVDDSVMKYISVIPNLQQLNLSGCENITDKGLNYLKNLKRLSMLSLYCCSKITDEGIDHLVTITTLQSLDLTGLFRLTSDSLKKISKSLINLRALGLGGCKSLTDDGFTNIMSLVRLSKLGLSYCKITGTSLRFISKLLNLQSLDLSHCLELHENSFLSLKTLTKMRDLNLSSTSVTDRAIFMLKNLPYLQKLDAKFCKKLTGVGIITLQVAKPHLEIRVGDCN